MTLPEAMTKARACADNAVAHAKTIEISHPHAYAVGVLTAELAHTYHELAAAQAEVERHQSFIRTQ